MYIKLFTEELKNKVSQGISDVIVGKEEEFCCDLLCPSIAIDILKDLGIIENIHKCGDMETNGWQWDYWIKFKYLGKLYMISGGGYYGDFKFSECED